MKKIKLLITITLMVYLSSCATIWGGRIDSCQTTKPQAGQPTRQIRPVALIGDILFFPIISLIVDFSDNAIYKPCEPKK